MAEAEDGAGAITAAARHQPDVVILDLGLPDFAGHEVLTRLRAVSPLAQIVVYTGSLTPERLPLSGEVEAFVTKDQDVGYLVDLLSRLNWRRYEKARSRSVPMRATSLGRVGSSPSSAGTGTAPTWSRTPSWW